MMMMVVATECKLLQTNLLKTHAKENCVDDDDAIECAIFSKQNSEAHMQKENCVDVR
jgi:hypothetical protein